MNKNKAIKTIVNWLSFNFLLPLIPLFLGMSVAYLRAKSITYSELLGGTELFFFSMTIFVSTKSDLESSSIAFSESAIYSIFSTLLPVFAIFTAGLFTIVFINQNVLDIGLNRANTANYAVLTSIFTSLICLPLELLIAIVKPVSESRPTGYNRVA